MNLVLFEKTDFTREDRVTISGRRFEHLVSTNRIKPGDELNCGLLNDRMGTARVESVESTCCTMAVRLDRDPPPSVPLVLVMALPRPKAMSRIIQSVTSLGVKQIFLVNSWRVEKSYWKSPALAPEKLRQNMILGLEQARDTLLPTIRTARLFRRFVEQDLDAYSRNSLKIVAHPKTDRVCPAGVNRPVTLAVGPEGGWIDPEIGSFERQGFKVCTMGERILRVETAVPCLISRIFT